MIISLKEPKMDKKQKIITIVEVLTQVNSFVRNNSN